MAIRETQKILAARRGARMIEPMISARENLNQQGGRHAGDNSWLAVQRRNPLPTIPPKGSPQRTPAGLSFLLAAWLMAFGGSVMAAHWEAGFQTVPDADKPWVYWWWLKGNVTEQSITRDLEAMKQNGIGGMLMFDARGYHESHVIPPPSRMEFMSDEWRRMLKFALREANRLGLRMSVNLSSCAGALKGPWEVGDDAPKELVWTATEVRGPQRVQAELRPPAGKRYWEVALLAVRHDQPAGVAEQTAPAAGPPGLADNWRVVAPKPETAPIAVEVVALDDKVDAQGRLVWDAPPGTWTLLRFGSQTMAGHEYDVDVLDARAVAGHFERMGRALLKDAGPLAGKTLTHFYSVSWEGAAPTWTPGLDRTFEKLHGYSLRAWLPVLAGVDVRNREESARFLRDYYKTLGDVFRDNFYGKLHELCRRAGLGWHSESGGPWDRKLAAFAHADQLAFLARNDMPQGEFWFRGRAMNRPAAMTAHIYGRRLAATEAFTHMVQHWSAHPAALKADADAALGDGINHFIWHTFTASPPELGLPGSEYFAGTHLNPNVTWWPQAGPFIAYLARGQYLLRQGKFVSDVCCYIGDRPYQHWGRGTNWSAGATLKLPRGHTYDLLTTEVLLDRLTVQNRELALPDGMRYRLLVVDLEDEAVPPAALRKISELAKAGATVVLGQRRPQRAPGLANYPAADAEVRRLADQLWGDGSSRKLGRGDLLADTSLAEALSAKGIPPDFEGPFDYTHRRAADTELYFVAGKGAADCVFRVSGKEPELWDPATGQIRDAVLWRAGGDGRTIVPLDLPENGSVFVVFRRAARQPHWVSVAAPSGAVEIMGRHKSGAAIKVWQNGPHTLATSRNQTLATLAAPLPAPLPLSGPWQVRFQPGRGAPAEVVFDTLLAWDRHPDPGIKFFSGQAVYRKTIELTEEQARHLVRLQLGEVHCIAQARLNGRDLGVIWTAPWRVELTGAVRPGPNDLEITVVNTWVNRLIGDAGLPEEKRLTKTNVALQPGKRAFKVYQGFASEDPLMPSGLLGPVRLEFGRLEGPGF